METLCKIRGIYRLIAEFEGKFQEKYDIGLNEGMVLCSLLTNPKCTSGEIAQNLGLSYSNTSKVIKSIERKGLIMRLMGERDKRQMCFALTDEGKNILSQINSENLAVSKDLKEILK